LPDVNLSRRGFLKLLGLGGMVAAVGMFANFAPLNLSSKQASALSLGTWATGTTLLYPTIHVALLKDGKIMTTPGSGWQQPTQLGPFKVGIIDLNASSETFSNLADDLFCCGFSQLADGNVVITGGTTSYATGADGKYHGGNYAYEFDTNSHTWNKVSSMAHGRWYPSMGTLPDGKVYVFTGLDEWGTENDLTEIYHPDTKTFSIQYDPFSNNTYTVGSGNTHIPPGTITPSYGGPLHGTNPDISYYSRTMIMPSGLVFIGGMRKKLRLWDPSNGKWTQAGDMAAAGRTYGNAVLLPLQNTSAERGKVLLAAGQSNTGATVQNTCEFVDFNAGTNTAPVISAAPSMTFARMYGLPVILPTGQVIIFGGTSGSNVNPVFTPEMYDPVANSWTLLPATTIPRWYHSVSLLLPDGRVWLSSGTPSMNPPFEGRTEFFSPGYMEETRPTISSQPTVNPNGSDPYNGTITIPTPDASSITSVSLLRLGNVTHHFDAEHRFVWLQVQNNSGSNVVVSAPINSKIAPPGYYMIHILNASGIPSAAKIIQIGAPVISGPDTTPPVVTISSPSARSPIVGPSSGVQIAISGSAYDSGSAITSVKISVDSGTEISATSNLNNFALWSATTTINAVGPHKIKAIATDTAGNTSSTEIPITVFFS
jgi:hypothetical protein